MSGPRIHPVKRVAGVMAVPTDEGQRVIAVAWEDHDPLTCDGQDLVIDTSAFLDCPTSGCRWSYDAATKCPDHARGNA